MLEIEADNREMIGQPAIDEQAVERRHQLAPGQVAAGAEDHQHGRIGVDSWLHIRSSSGSATQCEQQHIAYDEIMQEAIRACRLRDAGRNIVCPALEAARFVLRGAAAVGGTRSDRLWQQPQRRGGEHQGGVRQHP